MTGQDAPYRFVGLGRVKSLGARRAISPAASGTAEALGGPTGGKAGLESLMRASRVVA